MHGPLGLQVVTLDRCHVSHTTSQVKPNPCKANRRHKTSYLSNMTLGNSGKLHSPEHTVFTTMCGKSSKATCIKKKLQQTLSVSIPDNSQSH